MKWFYNLKISKKLLGAFLIVSFISVLIVWLGILRLKTISEQDKFMYNNCVISIQDLGTVSSKFELAMALTRDPVLITDERLKAANIDARNSLTKAINESLKDYEPRISSPEEKELYDKFLEARKAFRPHILKFNDYLKAGNLKEAALFFQGDFTVASENQRNALQNIIQYKTDYAKKLSQNNEENAAAATRDMILLAIIGFIISIGLGLFIANSIKRPVSNVLAMAQELLKGHVKARAKIDSKDELGEMGHVLDKFAAQLEAFADSMNLISAGNLSVTLEVMDKDDVMAPALNNIADTLRTLIDETKLLIHGAINGKLSVRGNSEKFKGGYRDIISGINDTLDAVIGPLNMAAEYVDRISKGDMPKKITEQYHGDFNELKNNLNGCIDAINLVITDVYSLSAAAVEGKLSNRADSKKHEGDFKKIIEGLNGTLDAVTGPLSIASGYMNNISKGVIPDLIKEDYKGDFNEIKTSINDLIQSTNMIITGINRIGISIKDGDLSDRGKPELFVGSWKVLIEDINVIIDSLVSNIRFMAKNVNDIAKGNIPEQIQQEYKGDYNLIKNDLNTCFASIKALINDMNTLSDSCIEGRLNTRANAGRLQGDYRKIVEGINNTLDAVIEPLNMASNYVDNLSKGIIPAKVTNNYKGDFNRIKDNLNSLIETFNGFVEAQADMAEKHDKGWIDEQINAEKFPGTYGKMAKSINELVKSHIDVKMKVVDIVTRYGKGDFSIDMDRLPGKKAKITESIDLVKKSLIEINAEIVSLADAAVKGDLAKRGNAEKFEYNFRDMVSGINKILEAVITPIKEGVDVLSKISTGDLTVRISSDYLGDHRLIKESINSVADSLSKTLNDVSEAVQATASASNQISSSTEEMAAGASEQTQQTTEVAGAVEEMTKTILENTRNASYAAETAKNAGSKALEGGKVVQETIEGMGRIADVVRKSATTVNELGKSSDQIGEIVQVIDDIADQTNLLALNAAIEAARAGEQGRGFAVVADEVRKLAERTTKATKEIASMIKQIQKDTIGAVSSMEEGTREVEAGKKKADLAGESLREIITGANKLVDIVTQVAAASEQQSSAAEEISRSIEAISSVTHESATGTQQIARAAEDLNRLTLNLENLVGQFKLSNQLAGRNEPKKLHY